jgi:glycosyltransferase involved in cell wall biosynthesis
VGAPLTYDDITVLPGIQDVVGNDVLANHYEFYGCDQLITLCDVFPLDPKVLASMNTAHWLPVDGSPVSTQDMACLNQSGATVIAMSRFGERELRKQGYKPLYMPHGINTATFAPVADRDAQREAMDISPETFVIGINAFNKDPVRKGFPEQMLAFAKFRERHPDSLLVVHSLVNTSGAADLRAVATGCGIAGNIRFPHQYAYATGLIGQQHLAEMYSALDLYSNCAYGEGFGLTIIEAQACGTPVVVTNATSMPELCGSGWKVDGIPFWVPSHNSWWLRPDIDQIAESYEAAWQMREDGDMPAARKLAREFALDYDVDVVQERYLKPVLSALEEKYHSHPVE